MTDTTTPNPTTAVPPAPAPKQAIKEMSANKVFTELVDSAKPDSALFSGGKLVSKFKRAAPVEPAKEEPASPANSTGTEAVPSSSEEGVELADTATEDDYKLVIGKRGDKTFEVPQDMLVPVKVAGKLEHIPLQELINDHSGRTNWNKKHQDLAEREKSFTSKVQRVDGTLNEIITLAKNGNPSDAFLKVARMAGLTSDAALKKYVEEASKIAEEWSTMPDEKRELLLEKVAIRGEKEDLERRKNDASTKKSDEDFATLIVNTITELGIQVDEFEAVANRAKEAGVNFDKLTPEQTVKEVAKFHKLERVYDNCEAALKEVAPRLADPHEFIKTLIPELGSDLGIDFSKEDIKDVIKALLGKPTTTPEAGLTGEQAAPAKAAVSPKAPSSQQVEGGKRPKTKPYRGINSLLERYGS